MSDTDFLQGEELEEHGFEVFDSTGLHCEDGLNDVQLQDLDGPGEYPSGESFEFDYLIPSGNTCIVIEINSLKEPKDKIKRYRDHLNYLRGANLESDETWKTIGVQEENLSKYGDVSNVLGVFITNRLERGDIYVGQDEGLIMVFRSNWRLIETYSNAIGEYSKYHFLDRVGVDIPTHKGLIDIFENEHTLHRESHAKVASGDVPTSHLYTFTVDPYDILPFSKVYRRDNFPGSSDSEYNDYQRRLHVDKLKSMRRILRSNQDFMFPNNILCVLSDGSEYGDGVLHIPKRYGSLSIIDGQHRLFSYASDEVKEASEDPKLMVTAIKFRNVGPEKEKEDKINKYSAKTFVEINTAQTEVDKDHLDFIKYDILEDTSSRALAAKVLLELNQRDNSVKGLFKTHQTGLGIISPRMIITGIKILTNTNKIERLQDADAGCRLQNKNGYESILDADIRELTNPQILITKSVIAYERLFDTSRRTFYSDWPNREGRGTSYTSLAYTKAFRGIVKLMWYFVSEGHSWNDIEEDLGNIKGNL